MSTPGSHSKCPICERPMPDPTELRCVNCGADLSDPDVLAQAQLQAHPAPSSGAGGTPDLASGMGGLAGDRYLGFSASALAKNSRGLALVGAGLYVAAFVMPVAQTWRGFVMSWDALASGPTLALLVPLVSVVLGLAIAFVPGIPAAGRAGTLGVLGLAGVFLGLGPMSEFALTQATVLHPLTFAILIAAVAGVWRIQRPGSQWARWALVAAIPIALAGLLIPADLGPRFPLELVDYRNALELKLDGAIPLATLWKAADHRAAPILFIALWSLAPLIFLPGAAALAWRPPRDAWDRSGMWLRPLVAIIVLYLPLGYALDAFNMLGWSTPAAQGLFAARLRMIALSLPMSLWAAFGLATIAPRGK